MAKIIITIEDDSEGVVRVTVDGDTGVDVGNLTSAQSVSFNAIHHIANLAPVCHVNNGGKIH